MPSVNVPILPRNIVMDKMIFPISLNSGVIPRLNPTVPSADVVSKTAP